MSGLYYGNYSILKSFKRELDVEQLKRLFNDHLKDKKF